VTSPGPSPFWSGVYGIASYDEFVTATDPYWKTVFPVDLGGFLRHTAETLAYGSPGGGPGVASAAYLTAVGYDGSASQDGARSTASAAGTAVASAPLDGTTMTQLIIPNCFQVTIQSVAGGHVVDNVVGVQNAGGTAAGAAAAVQTAWKASGGPQSKLSALVALTGFRAVDIGSSNGAIAQITDTTAGGVASSNALSTRGSAALIQWNGGTRSRSSRGRLYFGPLMEANIDVDGANLVTGGATSINGAFTVFRTSLSGSGYPLVVLSRKLSQAFAVSTNACEQIIATQRRRIR